MKKLKFSLPLFSTIKNCKATLSRLPFTYFRSFIHLSLTKAIALVVVACFFVSSVCRDAIAVVSMPESQASQYKQIFEDFILPYSYGKITKSHFAATDRVIVNIQDLHCHPKVQKNISNIIELFDKKYGVSNIYLEGAYGNVSTKWLSEHINNNDKKKAELLNKILETGKLTGAEYYSAISDRTEIIKGLEKKEPYIDNLKRFGDLLEKQEEIQLILKGIEDSTAKVKKQYYTRRQYKLEKLSQDYINGKIKAEKYYALLSKHIEKLGIDISKYKNTLYYITLLNIQKEFDYKKITNELQELLSVLKQRLPYSLYNNLLTETDNFKRADKLYAYILKISRDYNVDIVRAFSELNKYFGYIELSQQINPIELLKEEEKLTREINTRFSDTVAQREVVFLTHFEKYLKQYMSTKITSDDYEYYKENIETYKKLYNKYVDNKVLTLLKPYMEETDKFYEINMDRNEYFAENIFNGTEAGKLTQIKEGKDEINKIINNMPDTKRVDIIVTGGFHSQTVTELLQKEGVSYIVITPNVQGGVKEAEQTYYEIAKQQKEIDFQTLAAALLSEYPENIRIKALVESGFDKSIVATIHGKTLTYVEQIVNQNIERNEREQIENAKKEIKNVKKDVENAANIESDEPIDFEGLRDTIRTIFDINVGHDNYTDVDVGAVVKGVVGIATSKEQGKNFLRFFDVFKDNKQTDQIKEITDIITRCFESGFALEDVNKFFEEAKVAGSEVEFDNDEESGKVKDFYYTDKDGNKIYLTCYINYINVPRRWNESYGYLGEIAEISSLAGGFQFVQPVRVTFYEYEYETDENEEDKIKKDEKGLPIPKLDDKGNPIYKLDENGNKLKGQKVLKFIARGYGDNERNPITFEMMKTAADENLAVGMDKTKTGELFVKHNDNYYVIVNDFMADADFSDEYDSYFDKNSDGIIKDYRYTLLERIFKFQQVLSDEFSNIIDKSKKNSPFSNEEFKRIWHPYDDISYIDTHSEELQQDGKNFLEKSEDKDKIIKKLEEAGIKDKNKQNEFVSMVLFLNSDKDGENILESYSSEEIRKYAELIEINVENNKKINEEECFVQIGHNDANIGNYDKKSGKFIDLEHIGPTFRTKDIINMCADTRDPRNYSVQNIKEVIQMAQVAGYNFSEDEIRQIIESIRYYLLTRIKYIKAEDRKQFLEDINSLSKLYIEINEMNILLGEESFNVGLNIPTILSVQQQVKQNNLSRKREELLGKIESRNKDNTLHYSYNYIKNKEKDIIENGNSGVTKIKLIVPADKKNTVNIKELFGLSDEEYNEKDFEIIESQYQSEEIDNLTTYNKRRILVLDDRTDEEKNDNNNYKAYYEKDIMCLDVQQGRVKTIDSNTFMSVFDIDWTLYVPDNDRTEDLKSQQNKNEEGYEDFHSQHTADYVNMPIAYMASLFGSQNNSIFVVSGRTDNHDETTIKQFKEDSIAFIPGIYNDNDDDNEYNINLKPYNNGRYKYTIIKDEKTGEYSGFIVDNFKNNILQKAREKLDQAKKTNSNAVVDVFFFDDRKDSIDYYNEQRNRYWNDGIRIHVFQVPNKIFEEETEVIAEQQSSNKLETGDSATRADELNLTGFRRALYVAIIESKEIFSLLMSKTYSEIKNSKFIQEDHTGDKKELMRGMKKIEKSTFIGAFVGGISVALLLNPISGGIVVSFAIMQMLLTLTIKYIFNKYGKDKTYFISYAVISIPLICMFSCIFPFAIPAVALTIVTETVSGFIVSILSHSGWNIYQEFKGNPKNKLEKGSFQSKDLEELIKELKLITQGQIDDEIIDNILYGEKSEEDKRMALINVNKLYTASGQIDYGSIVNHKMISILTDNPILVSTLKFSELTDKDIKDIINNSKVETDYGFFKVQNIDKEKEKRELMNIRDNQYPIKQELTLKQRELSKEWLKNNTDTSDKDITDFFYNLDSNVEYENVGNVISELLVNENNDVDELIGLANFIKTYKILPKKNVQLFCDKMLEVNKYNPYSIKFSNIDIDKYNGDVKNINSEKAVLDFCCWIEVENTLKAINGLDINEYGKNVVLHNEIKTEEDIKIFRYGITLLEHINLEKDYSKIGISNNDKNIKKLIERVNNIINSPLGQSLFLGLSLSQVYSLIKNNEDNLNILNLFGGADEYSYDLSKAQTEEEENDAYEKFIKEQETLFDYLIKGKLDTIIDFFNDRETLLQNISPNRIVSLNEFIGKLKTEDKKEIKDLMKVLFQLDYRGIYTLGDCFALEMYLNSSFRKIFEKQPICQEIRESKYMISLDNKQYMISKNKLEEFRNNNKQKKAIELLDKNKGELNKISDADKKFLINIGLLVERDFYKLQLYRTAGSFTVWLRDLGVDFDKLRNGDYNMHLRELADIFFKDILNEQNLSSKTVLRGDMDTACIVTVNEEKDVFDAKSIDNTYKMLGWNLNNVFESDNPITNKEKLKKCLQSKRDNGLVLFLYGHSSPKGFKVGVYYEDKENKNKSEIVVLESKEIVTWLMESSDDLSNVTICLLTCLSYDIFISKFEKEFQDRLKEELKELGVSEEKYPSFINSTEEGHMYALQLSGSTNLDKEIQAYLYNIEYLDEDKYNDIRKNGLTAEHIREAELFSENGGTSVVVANKKTQEANAKAIQYLSDNNLLKSDVVVDKTQRKVVTLQSESTLETLEKLEKGKGVFQKYISFANRIYRLIGKQERTFAHSVLGLFLGVKLETVDILKSDFLDKHNFENQEEMRDVLRKIKIASIILPVAVVFASMFLVFPVFGVSLISLVAVIMATIVAYDLPHFQWNLYQVHTGQDNLLQEDSDSLQSEHGTVINDILSTMSEYNNLTENEKEEVVENIIKNYSAEVLDSFFVNDRVSNIKYRNDIGFYYIDGNNNKISLAEYEINYLIDLIPTGKKFNNNRVVHNISNREKEEMRNFFTKNISANVICKFMSKVVNNVDNNINEEDKENARVYLLISIFKILTANNEYRYIYEEEFIFAMFLYELEQQLNNKNMKITSRKGKLKYDTLTEVIYNLKRENNIKNNNDSFKETLKSFHRTEQNRESFDFVIWDSIYYLKQELSRQQQVHEDNVYEVLLDYFYIGLSKFDVAEAEYGLLLGYLLKDESSINAIKKYLRESRGSSENDDWGNYVKAFENNQKTMFKFAREGKNEKLKEYEKLIKQFTPFVALRDFVILAKEENNGIELKIEDKNGQYDFYLYGNNGKNKISLHNFIHSYEHYSDISLLEVKKKSEFAQGGPLSSTMDDSSEISKNSINIERMKLILNSDHNVIEIRGTEGPRISIIHEIEKYQFDNLYPIQTFIAEENTDNVEIVTAFVVDIRAKLFYHWFKNNESNLSEDERNEIEDYNEFQMYEHIKQNHKEEYEKIDSYLKNLENEKYKEIIDFTIKMPDYNLELNVDRDNGVAIFSYYGDKVEIPLSSQQSMGYNDYLNIVLEGLLPLIDFREAVSALSESIIKNIVDNKENFGEQRTIKVGIYTDGQKVEDFDDKDLLLMPVSVKTKKTNLKDGLMLEIPEIDKPVKIKYDNNNKELIIYSKRGLYAEEEKIVKDNIKNLVNEILNEGNEKLEEVFGKDVQVTAFFLTEKDFEEGKGHIIQKAKNESVISLKTGRIDMITDKITSGSRGGDLLKETLEETKYGKESSEVHYTKEQIESLSDKDFKELEKYGIEVVAVINKAEDIRDMSSYEEYGKYLSGIRYRGEVTKYIINNLTGIIKNNTKETKIILETTQEDVSNELIEQNENCIWQLTANQIKDSGLYNADVKNKFRITIDNNITSEEINYLLGNGLISGFVIKDSEQKEKLKGLLVGILQGVNQFTSLSKLLELANRKVNKTYLMEDKVMNSEENFGNFTLTTDDAEKVYKKILEKSAGEVNKKDLKECLVFSNDANAFIESLIEEKRYEEAYGAIRGFAQLAVENILLDKFTENSIDKEKDRENMRKEIRINKNRTVRKIELLKGLQLLALGENINELIGTMEKEIGEEFTGQVLIKGANILNERGIKELKDIEDKLPPLDEINKVKLAEDFKAMFPVLEDRLPQIKVSGNSVEAMTTETVKKLLTAA